MKTFIKCVLTGCLKNGGKSRAKLQESRESKNLIRQGIGTIKGQSVSLKMLALNLSNELDRPVIDNTGLTGNFNFEIKWTPMQMSPNAADSPLPTNPDRPSIFTALEEQLGLRLEAGKGPVEILIIDHAARPSKN